MFLLKLFLLWCGLLVLLIVCAALRPARKT
jgi:hypothetical protein